MPKRKKISPSGKLGLNQKQKTSASGDIFSKFSLHQNPQSAQVENLYSPVCYLCGSTKNITTFHAPGGVLGVCDLCNGGIV